MEVPGTTTAMFEEETDGRMTPNVYRRKRADEIEAYKKQGIEVHCCHIIAKSNGGGNHSDNYILAGANFNTKISNKGDPMMCALVQSCEGIAKVKAAIRASPNSGLGEQDAEHLVKQGHQMFRDYKVSHGRRLDTWDTVQEGGSSDELDGCKLLDPDYCEWVIQVWRYGAAEAEEKNAEA